MRYPAHLLLLVCAAGLLMAGLATAEIRVWTSGEDTFEGEFLKLIGERAHFRRKDGMLFMVKLAKLTEDDQAWIRKAHESAQPDPTPRPAIGDERSIGFRGDGTGVFPADCTPVRTWSETNNIAWKTPLINMGNGSPICAGGRVFVMCEPGWKADAPILVCIDPKNGRTCWQRTIDPFDTLPDDDEPRELRKKYFELLRLANAYTYRASRVTGDDLEQLRQTALEEGVDSTTNATGVVFSPKAETDPFPLLERRYGFARPVWHHAAIGMTFATPVSDGATVYVSTAYRTVAAVRFDGDLKWLRWHRDLGYPRQRNKSGPPLNAAFVASPIIVGKLLVVPANARLTAYSRSSGATVWEMDCDWDFSREGADSNYMVGSPARLQLATPSGRGLAVVFAATGELLRAVDGKVLLRKIGQQGAGAGPVYDGRDTVFITSGSNEGEYRPEPGRLFTEAGGHAIRLTMESEDEVKATRTWYATRGGFGAQTGVFLEGKLYPSGRCSAVAAATGKALWGTRGVAASQALVIADGHVFALNSRGACVVISLNPPGVVAVNKLDRVAPLAGEKQIQVISQTGRDGSADWRGWHFSRSVPFISGNRIFIRSFDHLYCIGSPNETTRLSAGHQ